MKSYNQTDVLNALECVALGVSYAYKDGRECIEDIDAKIENKELRRFTKATITASLMAAQLLNPFE